MQVNEYQDKAMYFRSPELSKEDGLINSTMGMCGEAGEAIDHVKKVRFHGHELDKEYLCKELGDIAWYLAEAAWALDLTLEEVFSRNISKLSARYPEGFSKERSIHRKPEDH